MADQWKDVEDFVAEHGGGGAWLKLDDGESALVAFVGMPLPREVAFVDNQPVEVTDELRRKGAKIQVKVAINVFIFASKETKVFEMSAVTFKTLLKLKAKYGLDKRPFEISKIGTGMKTKYPIMPEDTFTPEQQAALKTADPYDLRQLYNKD